MITVKTIYPYCAQDTIMEIHSRDITLLIDLMFCTTPACFSTFYRCATVPTLVRFFVYIFNSNCLFLDD